MTTPTSTGYLEVLGRVDSSKLPGSSKLRPCLQIFRKLTCGRLDDVLHGEEVELELCTVVCKVAS